MSRGELLCSADCGRSSKNRRPPSAVPRSLAATITTSPATAWPLWINCTASSLTGSKAAAGSRNNSSAGRAGTHAMRASMRGSTTLRPKSAMKAERKLRAAELLDLVNLGHSAAKRPHELSGGMRQRVALARSLAQDKPLLLMDEPFAALDAITRDLLHNELERIWKETGRTIIFVTHNVREAVRLGQRVLLLSSRPGRVVAQWQVSEAHRTNAAAAGELTGDITTRLREEIRKHA